MKYIQLLKEEILGNLAIVYHRGSERKLNRLLNQTYKNQSHIDFENYNQALYTTTDVDSQLNQVGNNNNMRDTYGDYIIKLAFKGISNCWFCNYNKYSKYNNCTIDNWKEQQFDKFNIPAKDRERISGDKKDRTANHSVVSKYFEKYNLLKTRIKGIQYWGSNDGNCLLIYDWTTAIPIAISKDECKTWKKIDKKDTQFSRNNFKNNDYIDTNKKVKFKFFADKNGDVFCSDNQLTTLQGAPEKVGRNFFCSYNKLTNLQGAPKEVGGNFDCSGNELTTLQGAPKEVGEYFYCGYNKLTKEEIIRYLKTAKIGGKIYTDYGKFKNQQEAIEKLSQLNESKYFNY